MTRGLGFLPDPPEVVEAQLIACNVQHLPGIALETPLPSSFTFGAYVPFVPDQGATSACVGEFFASSVRVASRARGDDVDPSEKAVYDVARLVMGQRDALLDAGCYPTAAINGVMRYGFVARERWPLTDANVNDLPPWDVFQHGASAILGQYYRIAPGSGAARQLKLALRAGHVPGFAMDVDESFMRYDGSDVFRTLGGPVVGRHMQAIVGWEDDVFIVLGSWGAGWGARGFARIASSFIESLACDSMLVPTVLPISVS